MTSFCLFCNSLPGLLRDPCQLIPPSARTCARLCRGRSYCAACSLPDWLKEVRSLRGSVLFDNGRRRHFRTEEGRLFDADPIDLYAYHILGYDAMRLVGGVGVYRLVPNGPACVTEKFFKSRLSYYIPAT